MMWYTFYVFSYEKMCSSLAKYVLNILINFMRFYLLTVGSNIVITEALFRKSSPVSMSSSMFLLSPSVEVHDPFGVEFCAEKRRSNFILLHIVLLAPLVEIFFSPMCTYGIFNKIKVAIVVWAELWILNSFLVVNAYFFFSNILFLIMIALNTTCNLG